jgi:uncharacterized iron-regulated membrane protein
VVVGVEAEPAERARRRGEAAVLRRIWRLHFWIGLFAAPTLIVLACTGLIILYTQPLDLWLHRDLKVVTPAASSVTLDAQIATARKNVGPGMALDAVTPPEGADRSTQVDFLPAEESEVGERNVTQVFIDPYTGTYLGQRHELDGLIGWANQLHRLFGNDSPTLALPSLGHLIACWQRVGSTCGGRARQNAANRDWGSDGKEAAGSAGETCTPPPAFCCRWC